MANDEALALYGSVKKMAEAMVVRKGVLQEQMAVLDAQTAALQERAVASVP